MRRAVIVLFCLALAGCASQPHTISGGHMREDRQDIPEHLGVRDGRLAPLPSTPNAVSSQATTSRGRVASLPMHGDAAATKAAILTCLEHMGRNAVVTQEPLYVHAVFTSPLLGFKDDMEFLIQPSTRKDGGVVHIRSASRVGYWDFGANRRRYEAFRRWYDMTKDVGVALVKTP